jgi:hypothetical protein
MQCTLHLNAFIGKKGPLSGLNSFKKFFFLFLGSSGDEEDRPEDESEPED